MIQAKQYGQHKHEFLAVKQIDFEWFLLQMLKYSVVAITWSQKSSLWLGKYSSTIHRDSKNNYCSLFLNCCPLWT